LLGLSNLFRFFTIRRDAGACNFKGDACSTLCLMNIEISKKSVIRDHQCITCMECTSEACCPAKGAVYLGSGGME
jgi:polyferredoxin